jgi:hypothetical protein
VPGSPDLLRPEVIEIVESVFVGFVDAFERSRGFGAEAEIVVVCLELIGRR